MGIGVACTLAVAACSGGDGDRACDDVGSAIAFCDFDASAIDDECDAESPASCECNPLTQAGCAPGFKCATLVEYDQPFLARTTCVPDGTVPPGGACSQGPA